VSIWGDDYDNETDASIEAEPIDVDVDDDDDEVAAIADQLQADAAAADKEEPPRLVYGSVDEFVREHLRFVYRRRVDGRHRCWAAEWWQYDEAIIRLEGLWRAWEHLRLDPATGTSIWWRDHADHHMGVLFDPDGPFAAADPQDPQNTCKRGEPLPYTAPPQGMFPDVRPPALPPT
jgi:hypothetical protein